MPDYRLAARRAAIKHGLDPDIFSAMINQESGFREGVGSSAGAQDIAQFMPATARAYGVTLGDNRVSDDLDGAARYLKASLKKYGSYSRALSVYNSGKPDAYKDPGFAKGQTYNYVKRILGAAGKGDPGSKGTTGATSGGGSTPTAPTTRTVTTPGVDRKGERAALFLSYLHAGGSNRSGAFMDLASNLAATKDTPATSKTVSIPGGATSSSKPGTGSTGGSGGTSLAGIKNKSPLFELIHNTGSGGAGYAVKNGKKVDGRTVFAGVWDGHKNHVHVAAGPQTIVAIGKLAQGMGLKVGENPHFGGVTPVHVSGSYHYKGEAIDVSGDSNKMNQFARRVEQLYGLN